MTTIQPQRGLSSAFMQGAINESPALRRSTTTESKQVTPSTPPELAEATATSPISPEQLHSYGTVLPDGVYNVSNVLKIRNFPIFPNLSAEEVSRVVADESNIQYETENSFFVQQDGRLTHNIMLETHHNSAQFHVILYLQEGLQLRLSPKRIPFLAPTTADSKVSIGCKFKILRNPQTTLSSLPDLLKNCDCIPYRFHFFPFSEQSIRQNLEYKMDLNSLSAKSFEEMYSEVDMRDYTPVGAASSDRHFPDPSPWVLTGKFHSMEDITSNVEQSDDVAFHSSAADPVSTLDLSKMKLDDDSEVPLCENVSHLEITINFSRPTIYLAVQEQMGFDREVECTVKPEELHDQLTLHEIVGLSRSASKS